MQTRRSMLKLAAAGVAASPLLSVPSLVRAQEKPIRIGVLYDLSGPFAAAGSLPCAIGAQIAMDLTNEHGGVLGKYKVEPVKADSQSKADVAINEAERLIDQENVDIILGIYSSAHAVPIAAKLEARKKILWITTAIASSVFKEGYSASTPDLSSLVTKLRRARADVILHTGYNPDITLFLRQSREAGLRFKMLIGNGAGYSQIDKLRETFGADVEHFCNVDPVPAQLLDAKTLAPAMGDLIKIMVDRYKAQTGAKEVPPHTSMGFNQTWLLLEKVLPIAISKYGGTDPEAVRKAALDVDIAPGGTIQGYGVKFFPPGTPMSGQNERSTPVVMQYVKDGTKVVWPTPIRTADPVLPLPASSPYAVT